MPPKETPLLLSADSPRAFWRSLDERLRSYPPAADHASDEFATGAAQPPTGIDRREFLKLLGGTVALAGISGCGARPHDEIVPYVMPPETNPADAVYYATVIASEGFGRGLLVKSIQGRPTKIEGNPDHPESLGATDAITQAAIVSLYDPDRSRTPRRSGQPQTWQAFDQDWLARRDALQVQSGRGFALLTEPTTSPSVLRAVHRLLDVWPNARWYQHTALARHDRADRQLDFDFAAADMVFSIGGDWFAQHPAALRYSRAFASRRRIENGQARLTRFYAIEPSPTVTGTMADLRLPASPDRTRIVLDAVASAIALQGPPDRAGLTSAEIRFVDTLATDLRTSAARALCVAGPEQPAEIQAWAMALNARLGSASGLHQERAAVRSDGDTRSHGDLAALVASIRANEVDTLWVLGANPVYTAPGGLDISAVLRRVPSSVHLGMYVDETAAACKWHLPESHFLESWGDLLGYDGTPAVQQPLIAPLIPGRSVLEMVETVAAPTSRSGYDLVRDTWRGELAASEFEHGWNDSLRRGVVAESLRANPRETPSAPAGSLPSSLPKLADAHRGDAGLTLVLAPDTNVLDGRFADNPWLQELPRPISHLVWDNAALISPALATQHGLADGDLVKLTVRSPDEGPNRSSREIAAAVLVQPGQATDCISLSLGYGRTAAGRVGNGRGFDAYPLRPHSGAWIVPDVSLRKLDRTYPLVTTQSHFAMEDRAPVRVVSEHALTSPRPEPAPSLYPSWPRGEYAWAMSIDLSTCTGCSACVVACQAENNIPSVGKDQVARGREMLWLRVDRYFSGDPATPRMVPQPVPCMHCENAPCELVCPVGATVHSTEGLNDMVYNRCVGTRYCSNNCPYKVRRFNFLDFRAPAASPVHLQENPDVTIRARGVMEKCTYCVQRINAGRIAAERETRRVRDGEIRTACQQVCPVDAIVFGDLNDPHSRVSARKREPTAYALLAELNTRPRTTYLSRVVAEDALSSDPAAQSEARG